MSIRVPKSIRFLKDRQNTDHDRENVLYVRYVLAALDDRHVLPPEFLYYFYQLRPLLFLPAAPYSPASYGGDTASAGARLARLGSNLATRRATS